MSDTRVTLIAKVTAKSGAERQLAEALASLIAPSRQEAGCLQYIVHVAQENPREFVIYESWKSEADFELHTKMPYLADLMARMPELVDGPPTRELLRELT